MNISKTTQSSAFKPAAAPKAEPKAATQEEADSPQGPSDSFLSDPMVIPVAMGVVAATAGIVGGFASGGLGQVARGVAFAGIGGGLGVLNSLGADTSGESANYQLSTTIGAAAGAAIGAFVIPDGGIVTGIAGTVLGGWGAAMSSSVFTD